MDVSKYMAKGFIKPDDVRVPREERIINVYESNRYDCLVLDFESGDQLSLNPITTRVLGKAYGTESDYWRDQVIELSHGTYKNKDGEDKDTVLVKPISAPKQHDGPAQRHHHCNRRRQRGVTWTTKSRSEETEMIRGRLTQSV
jgi:hypothetical protein